MSLKVHTVVTGVFQENCFILWRDSAAESVLIDPGADAEAISAAIRAFNLSPLAIVNTHAHIDHVGAVEALKHEFGIPFYLPKGEQEVLGMYENTSLFFGLTPGKKPEVDHWLQDQSQFKLGPFSFRVFPTPGHTPGGKCYLIGKHLFSGDTLFKGSVGRTDLPGGNWDTLKNSLKILIEKVPDDIMIHSGHGPDTTMGIERSENPFLFPLLRELN
ncbi:MAG: MBL fold metallo-hydrolase [Fidelibacterota bacterium]